MPYDRFPRPPSSAGLSNEGSPVCVEVHELYAGWVGEVGPAFGPFVVRSEGRHDRARALVLLAEQTSRQPANTGGKGNGSRPVQAAARHPASYGVVRVLLDAEGRGPELAGVPGAVPLSVSRFCGEARVRGAGESSIRCPQIRHPVAPSMARLTESRSQPAQHFTETTSEPSRPRLSRTPRWGAVPAVVADAGERPPA